MGNFINIYFSESTEKGSIKFADTNASFAVSRDDRRVGNVTAAGGKQVADEQVARDPVYSQGGGALRRSQKQIYVKNYLNTYSINLCSQNLAEAGCITY